MTNPQKAKGDNAERAVLAYLAPYWPLARRTKAGSEQDLGDIVGIVDRDGDGWAVSVKDRAETHPKRIEDACKEAAQQAEVLGVPFWVVIWKRRGTSDVGRWYSYLDIGQLCDVIGGNLAPIGRWQGLDLISYGVDCDIARITVRSWLALVAPVLLGATNE